MELSFDGHRCVFGRSARAGQGTDQSFDGYPTWRKTCKDDSRELQSFGYRLCETKMWASNEGPIH
jgi:hypothetical protein